VTQKVLEWIAGELRAGRIVASAVVISAHGSVPGKPGARLALSASGESMGTIGGAGLEYGVQQRLEELLEADGPGGEVATYQLAKGAKGYEVVALDSLCGGQVTIAMEVMLPMPHVLLMGGGHVAAAIATTCDQLGWSHSLHDTRNGFSTGEMFPRAEERHNSSVEAFLEGEDLASLQRFSHILLLGHDWGEDEARLLGLLERLGAAVALRPRIGVIASRAKWKAFSAAALESGHSDELLEHVICPIGLNIGAESPEEISVAVCAQLIAAQKEVRPEAQNWRERAAGSDLN